MDIAGKYLLRAKGIVKRFPGVLALNNVEFDLKEGEVHVLLGENGAGKSTLIKIISGAFKSDEGQLYVNGEETVITSPQHAIELGIATCYQEFNLIPYLSVAENIYIGRFPSKKGPIPFLDKKRLIMDAQKIIHTMGVDLKPDSIVSELGVAQQQMVEIAKALSMNARIYVLDEPSAVLSSRELDELFRVIRKLRSSGAGIVYISHRLEELPVIGDRVTVLRDGEKIGTSDIRGVSVEKLIEMMVGRSIKDTFPKAQVSIGKEVLKVEGMSRDNVFHDINLSVKEGEIVGIAGLVGSKRTEVVRAIFGADPINKGKVSLYGEEIVIKSPRIAVKNGISLVPEDRKAQGLVLGLPIRENVVLPSIHSLCKAGLIKDGETCRIAEMYVDKLGIKTPSISQKAMNLSGGNQQKVVISKWLASGCKLFLFDEPTRGIDVGAKAEVYALMNEIIKQGAAIIMVSSEMPEIINMCNRVYVMNRGRICAELDREQLSQEVILKYALMGNSESISIDEYGNANWTEGGETN